jgi:hypothetical protein
MALLWLFLWDMLANVFVLFGLWGIGVYGA